MTATLFPATEIIRFEVGKVYYATLAVAHSDFPVRCIKRTAKSVWFEAVGDRSHHYAPARTLIREFEGWGERPGSEAGNFHRWYVSSTKTTGGDFDPFTI
jgi:hypothetical protein